MYFNNYVKLTTRNLLNVQAICFAVILAFVIILPGMFYHPAFIHDSGLVYPFVERLRLDAVA